ncbi:putative DNA helicase [Alkaliphilus metalliredigens QYMF]|uniref:Putative DNA helicase n=1 Tax=Alkaliphilus metalliredigens (strain QYMF) TaxID=293826 RepID=A6TJU1_ALKMQ|nr:AAA domain-containing protein [Alkaliphilus metalliredigens]ABR46459.1 putative DNA helicase [Alkaliphilus metalliredigens QYMF]
MNYKTEAITKYLRSAVAAQANMGIDFKKDEFHIIDKEDLIQGKIGLEVCQSIFAEASKSAFENENESNEKSFIKVIICAKAIKTIFEANEKTQDEIDELTGIFYIPVILDQQGMLSYNQIDKKIPWFPREYLHPMVEPKLAIGNAETVDDYISNHVDQIEKIKSWSDYTAFFKTFYESIAESKFEEKTIRNMEDQASALELENNMYVFIDKTVHSTFHIMRLYNHLMKEDQPKPLYDNFISTEIANINPLVENDIARMQVHSGQMGGEYSLSPSQREAVNHFNCMEDGEILAVNGPPGTGKTTLLQSIVADMYVKRALNQEKAPLVVASSTNNQAVTNIIASFGNIKKMGISNLEERWIEGVDSFAAYFPSGSKIKEAKSQGYQYTNQKGEFFFSDVEDKGNIEKSEGKLIESCNEYFKTQYKDINACKNRLHEELLFFEKSKNTLLSLAQEAAQYDLNGQTLDQYLIGLQDEMKVKQEVVSTIGQRVKDWEDCYNRMPFFCKLLKFIKPFSRKIQTAFRLFMNNEEQGFINEYMSLDEIKEKYSQQYAVYNKGTYDLRKKKDSVEKIKSRYDKELKELERHHIFFYEKEEEKYRLEMDFINDVLDKKIRYITFWLAVHYYECRWVSGEDKLSKKQKGRNFKNVLDQFYSRLSMITPCLVMTFYMLPRQFLAYGDQKNFFLYNYIDLLIVDEAGQVSPEIAAGAFSLAKKAIVVGDIYQIEPIWAINPGLDKALAWSHGVVESLGEFELLEKAGLNTSRSSVMKVAAKCCKYEKFDERGLFLREHRRCYDEIINYSNKLVYKGNLQPMRGKGSQDQKLAIKEWPQMGFRQVDTDVSYRKGNSRCNQREAEKIVAWLKGNVNLIEEVYSQEPVENLVGVITPFRAQVGCIKKELKKQMPRYATKISIGTVHTFQGAERRIIILSTVYGRHDGCFFIDENESLMNVAVSRAKDNFFVFGDINCLKDTQNSASGLLKKAIGSNAVPTVATQ